MAELNPDKKKKEDETTEPASEPSASTTPEPEPAPTPTETPPEPPTEEVPVAEPVVEVPPVSEPVADPTPDEPVVVPDPVPDPLRIALQGILGDTVTDLDSWVTANVADGTYTGATMPKPPQVVKRPTARMGPVNSAAKGAQEGYAKIVAKLGKLNSQERAAETKKMIDSM